MHANEVFDATATLIRGTGRGLLPGAGPGQCDGLRPKVDRCPEPAAVHAVVPRTLMHFPGP